MLDVAVGDGEGDADSVAIGSKEALAKGVGDGVAVIEDQSGGVIPYKARPACGVAVTCGAGIPYRGCSVPIAKHPERTAVKATAVPAIDRLFGASAAVGGAAISQLQKGQRDSPCLTCRSQALQRWSAMFDASWPSSFDD